LLVSAALAVVEKTEPLKLDIGCGPNKKAGFQGVDKIIFPGVDRVFDAAMDPWPIESDSVDEVHCSHFLEHLDQVERCVFMNELYRVLKKDAKATIIVPHWASNRAYGDPTHKWPAISEMFFWYLDKNWRAANAPHTDKKHWPQGYDCDFLFTVGYGMHPALLTRNQEYQQYAMQWLKEAVQDTHATLIKR
jgi:ubiquinone/menaquinone biosynthesis C-methylase UbiE